MSHLIIDGWSARIVLRELCEAYDAIVCRRHPAWCETPGQFTHFVVSEHRSFWTGGLDNAVDYWYRLLHTDDDLEIRHHELPFAAAMSHAKPDVRTVAQYLSTDTAGRINQFLRRVGLTPYVFFRAVMALVLHGYTKKRRLAFWANFANRRHAGAEHLVGWCSTTHLVPSDISANPSCLGLCRQIGGVIRASMQYESLPTCGLHIKIGRRVHRGDTRVNFDFAKEWRHDLSGSSLVSPIVAGGREYMDLDVRVRETGSNFAVVVSYDSTRYNSDGIPLLLHRFAWVCEYMCTTPDASVSRCISQFMQITALS
jgi:hypothetical protein